jgi:hypothetical protein
MKEITPTPSLPLEGGGEKIVHAVRFENLSYYADSYSVNPRFVRWVRTHINLIENLKSK